MPVQEVANLLGGSKDVRNRDSLSVDSNAPALNSAHIVVVRSAFELLGEEINDGLACPSILDLWVIRSRDEKAESRRLEERGRD